MYIVTQDGEKVHAAFPAGVVDDVNYDGSIKSLFISVKYRLCSFH